MIADLAGKLGNLLAAAVQDHVVQVDRVGHRQQPPGRHLQRAGLVVVIEIGGVVEAGGGGELEGVQRVGDRRAEPAAQPPSGEAVVEVLRLLHRRALFLRGEIPVVAGVVDAVRHVLPAALFHGAQDLREVLQHRHAEADGAANVQRVGQLEQPPQADAVAVVALAVAEHVGVRRTRPGIAGAHEGRQVFVVLDVRHHPQRDARVARPAQRRAVQDRRVGHKVRFHGCLRRPRTPSAAHWRAARVDAGGD